MFHTINFSIINLNLFVLCRTRRESRPKLPSSTDKYKNHQLFLAEEHHYSAFFSITREMVFRVIFAAPKVSLVGAGFGAKFYMV